MRYKHFFYCVIFLLCVESASAWGVTGHRVVAEIAERHLTNKAKRELKRLMGEELIAFWANWADFIKSDTSWKFAGKWHYVDLPGHMAKDDFIRDLKAIPGDNLYTQIIALQKQLKDASIPQDKKQEALKFLIHLVGDLHQPLHVGRDEDQGGNKIQVTWFNKPTNLHVIWDETLIEFQQWSYTEYATVLNVAGKDQVKQWQNSSLEDWFYESHVLSDKVYDNTPQDSKLRYEYNYLFVQDLNNQLLKGGLRLAKILNEIFG